MTLTSTSTDEALLTIPQPELGLLRKVLEYVQEHPEEYDQGSYGYELTEEEKYDRNIPQNFCKTSHCIAGHAVAMTVGVYKDDEGDLRPNHPSENWFEAGRDVLGITSTEAMDLFSGFNSFTQVKAAAERIARRAGEEL